MRQPQLANMTLTMIMQYIKCLPNQIDKCFKNKYYSGNGTDTGKKCAKLS